MRDSTESPTKEEKGKIEGYKAIHRKRKLARF
jgi:hypothetical protein